MTETSRKLTPVIVSGPSGSGKTTVTDEVLRRAPVPLRATVSATTRPPRPNEVDGRNYHFLSTEEFERRRAAGDYLECCEVYEGLWYGTPRSEVEAALADGKRPLLEIDVQGAMSVLVHYPDAVTIFIHPGSLEELRRRLENRASGEDQAELQRRLARAEAEIAMAGHYQYQVTNDTVERAVQEICDILTHTQT